MNATLLLPHGAADEDPALGGATVMAARALTEGTERYDALALTEAAERLGASLHAEAGWDSFSIGVEVAASRLPQALELVAEIALAIEMGADASDIGLTVHPHPTLSETVMESAEVFFGQATHVYKPKRA